MRHFALQILSFTQCIIIFNIHLFLKVSASLGGNTPSAPRSAVIERNILPSVYIVLLDAEEANHHTDII